MEGWWGKAWRRMGGLREGGTSTREWGEYSVNLRICEDDRSNLLSNKWII
jgi:hypothetical protein